VLVWANTGDKATEASKKAAARTPLDKAAAHAPWGARNGRNMGKSSSGVLFGTVLCCTAARPARL
jgi:hypothetical protein